MKDFVDRVWNWRRVKLFGRSLSVAGIMLAVTFGAALGWAGFVANQASATAQVQVAQAPVTTDVTLQNADCSVTGAGTAGTPSVNGNEVACSFSGIDDTSVALVSFELLNNDSNFDACLESSSVNDIAGLTETVNLPSPVSIPGASSRGFSVELADDGTLIDHGGETLPDVVFSVEYLTAENYGGTCP